MFDFFAILFFLTHAYWIVALIAYALRFFVPALDRAATYGRLTEVKEKRPQSNVSLLFSLMSEANGFRTVYLFACVACASCIAFPASRSPILIPLLAHVTRRFYECCVVHKFTERPMPNLQLVFALGFYFCAATGPFFANWSSVGGDLASIAPEPNKVPLVCLLVMIWCQMQQHRAHRILALCRGEVRHELKDDKQVTTQPNRYSIPFGGLFEAVSCPHYFVEIVFYVTLLFVGRFYVAKGLLITFVVVNLADRANRTHRWYESQFGDAYPNDRNRLIPFIW
jgi:hypothetical protein